MCGPQAAQRSRPERFTTRSLALFALTWLTVLADGRPSVAQDAETILAAIEKVGGKVERDDKEDGKPVRVINFATTKATDADIAGVVELKTVRKLTLNNTTITDAGLDHVKDLPELEKLYLVDTEVTDAGLEKLKGLPKLQVLSLSGTKVTDAGLEHLKGMAELKEVFLFGTPVTDDAIKAFKEAMPNLKVDR